MNFVIVRTETGGDYSRVIARSIMWIAGKKHKTDIHTHVIRVSELSEFFERHTELTPANTVVHARAANPSENGWMGTLFDMERRGFKIVNKPSALRLTSDKLACSLLLQETIAHPRTWSVRVDDIPVVPNGNYIIKPITSMEQGARVLRLTKVESGWKKTGTEEIVPMSTLANGLGNRFVLQEYIEYDALYRIVVINGEALPYGFVDKPEFHPDEWKVSVCLSDTMQFMPTPPEILLNLAVKAQQLVGAKISFIDIFQTTHRKFVMSEINTACSLLRHERLAKASLGEDGPWNIHYRIAKYLWSVAFGG
jgi:glutathione synthase/RimK-type ligase-like ATP-grasp enzyme